MVTSEGIVGHESDPELAAALHRLGHLDAIDELHLDPDDAARHRLRAVTAAGRDIAIALPRGQRLTDGSVVALADDLAVVIRLEPHTWTRLRPIDRAAALEVGHRAGHLHWRVRFDGDELAVAGAPDLAIRLADLVDAGRVTITP